MTGYGKETISFGAKTITIEIKTINSKQFDLSLRLPALFREKEMEIRSIVSGVVERGKTDVTITVDSSVGNENYTLNQPLAERYYKELKQLSAAIGEDDFREYLPILSRMPEVFKNTAAELNGDEWNAVADGLSRALALLDACRTNEGSILATDLIKRVFNIQELLTQVVPFEKERTENVRNKLNTSFTEMTNESNFDRNRFEQELIYYFEKLDITEEKVRLKKHCEYFLDTLNNDSSNGKKLGFIAQEMGREINTLGAKANHFEIQRLVVLMKDELEKIKEQLLNIL